MHITEKLLYFLSLTHWVGVSPDPLASVISIFTLQFGLRYVIILMHVAGVGRRTLLRSPCPLA